jgi:tRNA modification GTPase
MLPRHHDPIAAIATAPGRAAIGIVRLSGEGLASLVQGLLGRPLRPREAAYLPFADAAGEPIDRGLAIFFPAPHSVTGEDVLELQAHGGPVVLQLLLARCFEVAAEIDAHRGRARLPGLRLAAPGEFTERAFLNGKLDLAQAEAVGDLIAAGTEAAARAAMRSLAGSFSTEVCAVESALQQLRVLVEATLDFPEEDVDPIYRIDTRRRLGDIAQQLAGIEQQAHQGALLRDGLTVVIAGQPNVGKSSLLNALAGAELAIVTPIPGTTRDRVTQSIQIDGMPLHVIDTAGLRIGLDEVERIGIERAWQAMESADVLLFLHDLTRLGDAEYLKQDRQVRTQLAAMTNRPRQTLEVYNKADVQATGATEAPLGVAEGSLCVSALSGHGLDALRKQLLTLGGAHDTAQGTFGARSRHLRALQQTGRHIDDAALQAARAAPAYDLLAEDLRLAEQSLAEIVGRSTPDDLLGAIFSSFCIGK